MEIYSKKRVDKLKMKAFGDWQTESALEEALSELQNEIVNQVTKRHAKIELDLSCYDKFVKKKIRLVLNELGYASVFENNKVTISVTRKNSSVKPSDDITSCDAEQLYLRYPLMPAYCALAILELSKLSKNDPARIMIDDIIDELIGIINERIDEKIRSNDEALVLFTYDPIMHMDVESVILANIYQIKRHPFEDLFENLGFRIDPGNGFFSEYHGSDGNVAKCRVLRAPVLVALIEKIKKNGLKSEGTNWNDHVIIISI